MTQTIKISNLPNAGVLTGSEVLPIVVGGVTKITTTSQVANLAAVDENSTNVIRFGAIANGATDPATLATNVAAINLALQSLDSIYIPPGCCYTRSQITGYEFKMIVDDSRYGRMTNRDYWWAPTPEPTLILAHRGFAELAVENTMPAFTLCYELNADGVETDMRTTLDGVPVIFHDDTMTRMSGGVSTAAISSLTFAQVETIDIGTPWSPIYAGTVVPSLDQFLDFAGSRFGCLQMEIKGYRTQSDISLYLDAITSRGLDPKTTIMSFLRSDLNYVRARNGTVTIGQYVSAYDPATMKSLALMGRAVLGVPDTDIVSNPGLVAECRAEGVAVAAWTLIGTEGGNRVQQFIDAGVARLVADNTFAEGA
jgi:glycerophosphoryl diester phosphodiesterase